MFIKIAPLVVSTALVLAFAPSAQAVSVFSLQEEATSELSAAKKSLSTLKKENLKRKNSFHALSKQYAVSASKLQGLEKQVDNALARKTAAETKANGLKASFPIISKQLDDAAVNKARATTIWDIHKKGVAAQEASKAAVAKNLANAKPPAALALSVYKSSQKFHASQKDACLPSFKSSCDVKQGHKSTKEQRVAYVDSLKAAVLILKKSSDQKAARVDALAERLSDLVPVVAASKASLVVATDELTKATNTWKVLQNKYNADKKALDAANKALQNELARLAAAQKSLADAIVGVEQLEAKYLAANTAWDSSRAAVKAAALTFSTASANQKVCAAAVKVHKASKKTGSVKAKAKAKALKAQCAASLV